MRLKKGDVVTVATQGDYGKPRPAVVFQSDTIATDSVLLIPFTTHLISPSKIRIVIKPKPENGLQKISQTMTEKITAVKREKIGETIGRLDAQEIRKIEQALLSVLDI